MVLVYWLFWHVLKLKICVGCINYLHRNLWGLVSYMYWLLCWELYFCLSRSSSSDCWPCIHHCINFLVGNQFLTKWSLQAVLFDVTHAIAPKSTICGYTPRLTPLTIVKVLHCYYHASLLFVVLILFILSPTVPVFALLLLKT